MASIHCKCGACEIQFKQQNNLFRLECCCYNCVSAVWYMNEQMSKDGACPNEQTNKDATSPLTHFTPNILDSNWFPNDYTIVKGEEHLGAFKLFDDADTTRVYCKKCSTLLLADHPAYGGKIVLTQVTNYGVNNLQNAVLCEVKARHFLKDLSKEEVSKLPKFKGDEQHIYQGVAGNLMAALPEILENGCCGETMNIQKLVEKIGVMIPDDCQERLCGGPPTLMQQAATSKEEEAK